jgi:hypothetical protein
MELAKQPSSGLWRRSRRVLAVLGAAALFFGVASVIKPDPRGAGAVVNQPQTITGATAAANTDHPKGWKLIGTLEGREHILKCWATSDGPRYSVHAPDGRVIQDDLPADEVYRGFPDIDLLNLRADPPTSPTSAPAAASRGTVVDFVDVWRE